LDHIPSEVTMEFQQLEMFAAIVEEGSMRRASERVFRTGPAVSIALKKLEEEVGSPLFNKSDRKELSTHFRGQSVVFIRYSHS
jgi:DNA-binding transcriptional LysR family regulator